MNSITKTMEDIVCYWIEAVHTISKLERLSVYTDEADLTNLVAAIDNAAEPVIGIMSDAEDKLGEAIESAIESGTGDFGKYQGKNIQNRMEDLTDMLHKRFKDIEGPSKQEQMENFNKVLFGCMDEICNKAA
ncbi:MAG: hypothetical protein II842_07665 [Butyrivibrio sp.]|nr:hypothetical protein [Butyrivibrio sp.]